MLAAGVLAIFVAYFLHVGTTIFRTLGFIARVLDERSERRRQAIEHENRFGPPPLWLRVLRVVLVLTLVGILGYSIWRRMAA